MAILRNHSATFVKAYYGCCRAHLFDLCAMLESYDFYSPFLLHDLVIN